MPSLRSTVSLSGMRVPEKLHVVTSSIVSLTSTTRSLHTQFLLVLGLLSVGVGLLAAEYKTWYSRRIPLRQRSKILKDERLLAKRLLAWMRNAKP